MKSHVTGLMYALSNLRVGTFGPNSSITTLRRLYEAIVQHRDAGCPLFAEPAQSDLLELTLAAMEGLEVVKQNWGSAESKIEQALKMVREEVKRGGQDRSEGADQGAADPGLAGVAGSGD